MVAITFILANKALVLGVLLAVSELLAVVPSVQANSVFQLVVGALKKAKEVVTPTPPAA